MTTCAMRSWALGLVLLAISSLTACSVSEDQEVEMGRQNAEQINARLPMVRDAAVADYIQQLGLGIAHTTTRADLDWRFFVVDSKEVNAFALPGGFIYVNRGLIERADRLDELGGALGHEIGHVVRRHSVQQMQKGARANAVIGVGCSITGWCDNGVAQTAIQVGGAALFARYSRDDEAEADSEAVVNVLRAGMDPEGIPSLFRTLLDERQRSPMAIESFFASHPMEEERLRATQQQIDAIDPALRRNLVRDNARYREFRARLRSLP
jgi:predicted Zn-dependent protease